tara:strand:+ start:115 stop:390 length:276 start_codon:yes stop_codon:yes gene_type:complete
MKPQKNFHHKCVNINQSIFSILDNQDLILSKKLIATYKERLENEIIKRSNKLRIPQKISKDIITNNYEIKELQKALDNLEGSSVSFEKAEE